MNLFHEFGKKAPNKIFISVVLGGIAGMGYASLIPVVVSSLAPNTLGLEPAAASTVTLFGIEVSNPRFALLFFAICALIFVARLSSRLILVGVSLALTADLRVRLCRAIARAPVADIELAGGAKLTAVLTEDVRRIVTGSLLLPNLLTNFVTFLGTLTFLMYLNMSTFLFVISAIFCGLVVYQIPIFFGGRIFKKSREMFDDVQEAVRGLIYGVKELKLDANKRAIYFDDVLNERERILLKNERSAFATFIAAESYGDMISFFIIGTMAFIFVNYNAISTAELIGVVMALLYITGPISAIMGAAPQIAMAKASMKKVEALFGNLKEENSSAAAASEIPWHHMALSNVTYSHRADASSDGFSIGPISLAISKGEVVFLVGGNGSGKSTLGKVLSLHYEATGGQITFDGVAVTNTNVGVYRQGISAIFTDYYLFDRFLHDLDDIQLRRANSLLASLRIDDKVSIIDGKFSTLKLSDGQRKRLALLVALMDGKQLYIFDEWAADQDPVFKEIFYKEILPELKKLGKAVVVISHDDRYFDVADRVFMFENGQVLHGRMQGADAA